MSLLYNSLGNKEAWPGITQPGQLWCTMQFCPGLGFLHTVWLKCPAPPSAICPLLPTSGCLLTHGFFCPLAPTLHLLSEGLLEVYSAINCCSFVCLQFKPLEADGQQATSKDTGCPRVTCPPFSNKLGGHKTHSRKIGPGNPLAVTGLGQMSWHF